MFTVYCNIAVSSLETCRVNSINITALTLQVKISVREICSVPLAFLCPREGHVKKVERVSWRVSNSVSHAFISCFLFQSWGILFNFHILLHSGKKKKKEIQVEQLPSEPVLSSCILITKYWCNFLSGLLTVGGPA